MALPGVASAQTSTTAIELDQVLEPVRVRAARPVSIDPSASITVLDPSRVDRARASGEGLSELAERAAGVRIVDSGGVAHERRLSIRGGSPVQSLVLLDGVALRSPFATGADLSIFASESISRVALIRGGSGAALGDGAIGGALLVDTISSRDAAPIALALTGGSFGTFGVRAAGSASPASFAAEIERSSGDFSYLSRLEGLPDEKRTRGNNDASRQSFSARIDRPLGGGTIDLLAAGALRSGGVPGLETQERLTSREQRALATSRIAWRRGVRRDRAGIELALSGSLLELDYRDADPLAPLRSSTQFLTASGGGALALRSGDHLLRLGLDLGAESSRSTEHGAHARARIGGVVSDELRFSALRIFGAVRAAKVGASNVELLPRLGAALDLGGGFSSRLAAGRSFRAPAIDELYHPSEAGFSGNPALLPETAWEGELALRFVRDTVSVELTSFARRLSDAIVYLNQNAFVVRPENIGSALVFGAEIEGSAGLELERILNARIDLAAAVLSSRLPASDAPLPGTPPFSSDVELVLSREWIELFTRLHFAAESTANTSGTLLVEPYVRWDAGLALRPANGLSLALNVHNLLDDLALETMNKIPLPGRAFFVTLRWEASDAS